MPTDKGYSFVLAGQKNIAQIPLGLSRLDTTQCVRRVELVLSSVSSRAVRQAPHSQKAWARHVKRVETSQVAFGLDIIITLQTINKGRC